MTDTDGADLGATEEISTTERPAWLPKQFNSPEDLAKSYQHASSKITEQGQELSSLRARLEEIEASQQQYQTQQQSNDIEQQLYDAYESGDGRAIAAANAFLIQQAMEQVNKKIETIAAPPAVPPQLVVDYAERSVASKYGDWQEVKPKMADVIQSNPVLRTMVADTTNPDGIAGALETAYKLAKFETASVAQQQVTENLDELARLTKNQAQTLSGGNSSTTEQMSYWDTVKQARSGIPRVTLQ